VDLPDLVLQLAAESAHGRLGGEKYRQGGLPPRPQLPGGQGGLACGVLLFLLSVSLTLIFGMLDFVNLTHGSYYMLGVSGRALGRDEIGAAIQMMSTSKVRRVDFGG